MTNDNISRAAVELKPCPFCGGEAKSLHSNGLAFAVRCGQCKAQTDLERCEADAHSAWNRRATPPAQEGEGLREAKDGAYEERNHLVSALARLFPSGTARTSILGWDAEWHGCCYIDLPTGQISYHYHDSQAHLFADLPAYKDGWDGHDKSDVHARLAAIRALPSATGGDGLRGALANASKMMDHASEVLHEREIFGTADLMKEAAMRIRATLNKEAKD